MTKLTLNDGRSLPQLGLGTYQIPDSQVAAVVRRGLDTGYRLVDTAAIYGNERGVGEGFQGADAFLTTKLWNGRHRDAEAALDESLALLGVEAWQSLIALRDAGKAKSIGVSNFLPEHLDRIIDATGVVPAVNQIELHPRFQQREARAYHQAKGIVTQSWSPLGQGGELLKTPEIMKIAEKHGRSAAQVVLAWHLAHGLPVIPKAADADHMADNFAATELTLDDEDMAAIDALDNADGRIGPDPREM